jgi:uncharacterized membrane protein
MSPRSVVWVDMETINLAHVHLILNHLPTIGFGLGLLLYVAAWFGKNDSLKKTSLILLFLIAVMAIPTYVSGNAAEGALCPPSETTGQRECPPGVSISAIRTHEDLALGAFALMETTGFFAWLALWQLSRKPIIPSWNWNVVLILSLATFGAMALAAGEGGEIRHSEIRANKGEVVNVEGARGEGLARSIGAVVAGNTGVGWLWPACEALHFVGLCILFGVVLIVDLRILGLAKGLSFSSLFQLLPLGMLGFVLNFITGMAFFLASPGQYTNNVEFHRKVLFIVLAGINVLYFMLVDETWAMGAEDNAPLRAKLVAASAIFLWIGILYYGHMLPFLGNSF